MNMTKFTSHQSTATPILLDSVSLIPSPVVFFPKGRVRVEIIQPEYLSLVAEVCKQNTELVMAFQNEEGAKQFDLGIHAKIVNFDSNNQGVLTIDVQGEQLVSLSRLSLNSSGIWVAKAQFTPHWSNIKKSKQLMVLTDALRMLYRQHKNVSELYSYADFDCPKWVCGRLIEIMPISYGIKKTFLKADSFEEVIAFLMTIFDQK